MPYKMPEPKKDPIHPEVMNSVEARWRSGEPLPVTANMFQLDLEQVRSELLDRGYKAAQDRWNTRHCGTPERDLFGRFTEAEQDELEEWLAEEVKNGPELQLMLEGVQNSNHGSLMAARRLHAKRNPSPDVSNIAEDTFAKIRVVGIHTQLDESDSDHDATTINQFFQNTYHVPADEFLKLVPPDWKPGLYDLEEVFYGNEDRLLKIAAVQAGADDLFVSKDPEYRYEPTILNASEIERYYALTNSGNELDAQGKDHSMTNELKMLDREATKAKVIDDDVDEIRVEFNGDSIRSWTYQDEQERRLKMGLAHEFAEGFYQAQLLAQPEISADPNLGTGHLREELISLRDNIKGDSRRDAALLASAVNRLNELSSASSRLLGARTAGEHPKPPEKRPDASSTPSM